MERHLFLVFLIFKTYFILSCVYVCVCGCMSCVWEYLVMLGKIIGHLDLELQVVVTSDVGARN